MARTKEQINSLREALGTMFGPYSVLMSDDQYDRIANKLQLDIWVRDTTKYTWLVKVQFGDAETEVEKNWNKIRPETVNPVASYWVIYKACWRMLLEHEYIRAIHISRTNPEDGLECYTVFYIDSDGRVVAEPGLEERTFDAEQRLE